MRAAIQIERMLALGTPLSIAVLPLLDGLARARMLRGGAAQRQAQLGGMRINYYEQHPRAGPSPALPIVLVHGIADSALTWALLVGPLARTRPVYALDLPGYGQSGLPAARSYSALDEMCELLAQFLRRIVGGPALVAGNSMGGWLAIKLGWAAPELVRGAFLLNAGGAPLQGRDSWQPFADTIAIPDMRMARKVFRQMFGAIPAPLLYLGQHSLQATFQRQIVREFVASLSVAAPEDVLLKPQDLRALPVPAALIWGLGDRFLPPGSLEFFAENMPSAPKLLLRHCGHLPQRERPLAVLRFIQRYAAEL